MVGKNTYDAFLNNDLEAQLKKGEVEKVVICGVLTDCCVETTAKSAFNRGFETWIAGDACGTATRQAHKESLSVFENYYESVLDTDEVTRRLE